MSLPAVSRELRDSPIAVGAQNMHPADQGAFTGEISGPMLVSLCRYVILGHSERRHLLGETDAFVNDKVRAALRLGLTPILCVGETLPEREAGQASAVVERQVTAGLARLEPAQITGGDGPALLAIAYEPVWAIGTGRAATPETAQAIMGAVRYQLGRLLGPVAAASVPLLYGGSVTPENIAGFAGQPDVDGALVGGASLRPADFARIVRAVAGAHG